MQQGKQGIHTGQYRLKTISLEGNIYGTWRRNIEWADLQGYLMDSGRH
jgi:hypothetical protein